MNRFPYQLVCSRGDATYAPRELINLCRTCGGPLLVQYDLSPAPELRVEIRSRPATMWRYAEVLPARDEDIVTLGEGLSTLKEPYRVEGKKIMGYELLEDLGRLPDVILYPTGGGTGLIGMWKAFDEMQRLGWIGAARPRMFTVQSSGCAPVVRAFEQGLDTAPEWESPKTSAWGLRVPRAIGDRLMLAALRQSGGGAVAVDEDQIEDAADEVRTREGIDAGP